LFSDAQVQRVGGTSDQQQVSAVSSTKAVSPLVRHTLSGAGLLFLAGASWWVTRTWLKESGADANDVALRVIVPLCVAAVMLTLCLGHERFWAGPRRQLRRAIEQIREGKMPIDALKDVGGGMSGVAADVAQVFHDARRLQQKIAEKEHEARQRVANKADSLQRVIGTLRLQAIRDPLTGLFNRRAFDELLPRLMDHCKQSGEDLSILMIDVDNFKPLNDTLGHPAGDSVLRSIAQLIRSSVQRPQDVGFRIGGDEFVVMPGAPPLPARNLAERLASLVSNLARTLRVPSKPGLSIGVCSMGEMHGTKTTPQSLLAEADRRLYEVKQKKPGRAA
jgi:diguanylate cyclase (GGDEF)-like protein